MHTPQANRTVYFYFKECYYTKFSVELPSQGWLEFWQRRPLHGGYGHAVAASSENRKNKRIYPCQCVCAHLYVTGLQTNATIIAVLLVRV